MFVCASPASELKTQCINTFFLSECEYQKFCPRGLETELRLNTRMLNETSHNKNTVNATKHFEVKKYNRFIITYLII